MAMDKYAKLELFIRTEFRAFYLGKLSKARSKAILLPGFEIPRAGQVDLYVVPKEGLHLCLVQRSDYVAAYKHTIGQFMGTLAHFHKMTDRELREAIRNSKAHPDMAELKQGKINALNLSKRFAEDRKAGKIQLVLVTELPEVPQQAKELEASFMPIANLVSTMISTAIKRKKLSLGLEVYCVAAGPDEAKVTTLATGIKPLLKGG